jgi:hypothetical protein
VDGTFLEIYLILYDLLNDDDEELRDIAALAASWVLSYSTVSPEKAVTLSPLNASELFATFIAQNYAESELLFTRAVQYILGLEPRIGDSSSGKKPLPVSTTTAELRKESTILFEEEKQNLFIEAIREIDVWTTVLTQLSKPAYDEELLKEVFNWVSEGLACFSDILATPDGEDGLVGWMAKPEAYTLGMRVINLAVVMISKEVNALGLLGDKQSLLRKKMDILLERGRIGSFHADLLARIERALESS